VRRPQLQSTFARAVVPVLAGIVFFAILGLGLWGAAALISRNSDQTTDYLAPTIQEMGSTAKLATAIAKDGPILLNDLIGNDSHIVLDHTGTEPGKGWALYLAHPADRTFECTVEVVRGTATFTDCEGRTLTVDQLASVPQGVRPVVNKEGTVLTLDLTPS
jgi:hypothetical protein